MQLSGHTVRVSGDAGPEGGVEGNRGQQDRRPEESLGGKQGVQRPEAKGDSR